MINWFRSYHGAPTDPKLGMVAKRCGVSRGDVAAIWWSLLDHASQSEPRGSVSTFDIEQAAIAFDYAEDVVSVIVQAMYDKGMIRADGILATWEKWQPKREDSSAERAKDWRERKRTQANANEHREEKSREDKSRKSTPLSPLNDSMRQWAAEKAPSVVDLAAELESYRDWQKQNGKRPKDESAGFRNWLRRAQKFATERKPAEVAAVSMPRPIDDDQKYRTWLKSWRSGGVWPKNMLGPAPGEPGCRVPERLWMTQGEPA